MKTYNWKRADTAEARERLKDLLDNREEVIIRWFGNKHPLEYAVLMDADRRSSFNDGHDYYKIGGFSIDSDFWMTSRTLNDLEFLDPEANSTCNQEATLVSDEKISFVASDESNHHDWNDLAFKQPWADGFEAGAKWMRGQMEGVQK